jgi:dTDP-4-amino-4,6-dideoxygalactose transaminase
MQTPVPLLDLGIQNKALQPEILSALQRLMDKSAFILGQEVTDFEKEMAEFQGLSHSIACASGSDALLLPLMCAEVGPGDEVLVPSFTFYATAAAVARLGAKPVFVDSDESYNICLKDAERKITARTKAIIPVHLFGLMVDMPKLMNMVNGRGRKIYVIEDCAQSIGADFDGRKCGNFGDYGAFSFYPTKNLGAMGDAGLMSALSEECADRLRMLRVHGSKERYFHQLLGVNSRLDAFQAAVLRIKLRHLPEYEKGRERLALQYLKLFRELSLKEVSLPQLLDQRKHVWNQFTVRAEMRDQLKKFLAERKIGSEVYYPLAMHKQKAFLHSGDSPISLPLCESLEREVLSLPIYPEMPLEQVAVVVEAVGDFYKNR